MKLYIDDMRDPKKELGEERAEGMVWIKEYWAAQTFLLQNEAELTEIHFDHYLDGTHTAGELVMMVTYRRTHNVGFKKLTDIYLHSSDESIVEDLIECVGERLAAVGVTVHNNSRG